MINGDFGTHGLLNNTSEPRRSESDMSINWWGLVWPFSKNQYDDRKPARHTVNITTP